MSSEESTNYKTAAEFEGALWLAFEEARGAAPDDDGLRRIGAKRAAADAARATYDAQAACDAQVPALALLRGNAVRAQDDADTAVRKWYSGQWRGRQTRWKG